VRRFWGTGRTGAQLAGDGGVGAWPVADRSTRHRRQCWHSSWKSAGSVPAWVPSDEVSLANLFRLDVTGVQMACLSYLEPSSFTNARYLVRRLRRRLPQAKIVDGFWTLTPQEVEQRDALAATRADCVVTSLRQAVEQVVNAAKEAPSADLESENRAPTAAAPQRRPPVIPVVEFPIVFDESERPESVHEEPASPDHFR
jgi:hypothetical protein